MSQTLSPTPAQARPLAGRTIVVTRPQAQAAGLAMAIEAAGGQVLIFPLLHIEAADPAQVEAAAAHLADYAIAFFVSPNAVAHALPALLAAAPWPGGLTPAAVGVGTETALARFGIAGVVAPQVRFDSEALLELPEFAAEKVRGKRVAIFRGDGGRELVADTLRERGASVDYVTCYHRRVPAGGAAPLVAAWAAGRLDGIVISSSEGLRNLWDMLDESCRQRLVHTPLFVPHARIAEAAHGLGLSRVVLTSPADAGLLAGLCAYNWTS